MVSPTPLTTAPYTGTALAALCDDRLAMLARVEMEFTTMHQPVREAIILSSGCLAMFSNHEMATKIAPFVPSLDAVLEKIDAGAEAAGLHPVAALMLRICKTTVTDIQRRYLLGPIPLEGRF